MHVIGTAGHVDHGKSALVLALTGTDPDRWVEEQRRGMTLDLGFAYLRFDDGVEAGIVDVPGHERYLRNMLAGAAGMELLLLVVAANEGVRPQTVEHLAILDYLNVRQAIVVLTKSDLVDEQTLAAVTGDVRRATHGSVAQDAPMLAVSAVTGAGIPALREAIHAALVALPPRAPQAPPFLPIDRVFTRPGAGTVVTGTLMQGTLRVGSTLRISPPDREVRIRALHVFGAGRDVVEAGARVAVNLPGVDVAELHRGAVLADAGFEPATELPVSFAVAGSAPARRTAVRVSLGAAEVLGTLVFDGLAPDGDVSSATLRLRRPAVTYPGQPFVARALSPMTLLGGGRIAGRGVTPSDSAEEPEFEVVARVLEAANDAALEPAQLAREANLRVERVQAIAEEMVARGEARRLEKPPAYLSMPAAEALSERIASTLQRREAEAPWIAGTTLLALARELQVDEPQLLRFLASEVQAQRIEARAGYYFLPQHQPRLSDEQRVFFASAIPVNAAAPLIPASLEGVVEEMRRARIAGLTQAFDMLVATGALVKVGTDVYRGEQIETIRRRLGETLEGDGTITPARFRDAVGTTRKYALPLLEWFDATGVTVRDGDIRRLRGSRSQPKTPA